MDESVDVRVNGTILASLGLAGKLDGPVQYEIELAESRFRRSVPSEGDVYNLFSAIQQNLINRQQPVPAKLLVEMREHYGLKPYS